MILCAYQHVLKEGWSEPPDAEESITRLSAMKTKYTVHTLILCSKAWWTLPSWDDSPRWCRSCGEQAGPPWPLTTWREPGTHSYVLQGPHLMLALLDPGLGDCKGELSKSRVRNLTADCRQIEKSCRGTKFALYCPKMEGVCYCPKMKEVEEVPLTCTKLPRFSMRAGGRFIMNWLIHARAHDLWEGYFVSI